jgi:hypothetical protein
VKEAPSCDANVELTESVQDEVCRHYGLPRRTAQQQEAEQESQPAQPAYGTESPDMPVAEQSPGPGKKEAQAGGMHLKKIARPDAINEPAGLQSEGSAKDPAPPSTPREAPPPGEVFKEDDTYIPLRRQDAGVESTGKTGNGDRRTPRTPAEEITGRDEIPRSKRIK